MGFLSKIFDAAEGHVWRLAQDNAWYYIKKVSGLDVKMLPSSLVDDAHARMILIYEEMSRQPNVVPFNVQEEAALRLAFVAARAAATKSSDPGELAMACARVVAAGQKEIRPMCLVLIDKALGSDFSSN